MWIIPEDIGKNDPVNMDYFKKIDRSEYRLDPRLSLIVFIAEDEKHIYWHYDSKEKRDAAYRRIIQEISGKVSSGDYIDSSKCEE